MFLVLHDTVFCRAHGGHMWRMLYSGWGTKMLRKAPPLKPGLALPCQGSFLCVALARSGLPVAMRCVKVGSGRLVSGPSPPLLLSKKRFPGILALCYMLKITLQQQ